MIRFSIGSILLAVSTLVSGASAAFGTKYIFIFGDSYTSSGFNIAGAKPSTTNPLGNPPLPGDTLAGGMTWAGHITTEHNTSLTLTYNFAISGSTVDNAIIQGYAPDIPSVTDQMATWMANLKDHPDYAPWNSEDALFFIWVGINDVGNSFSQPGIQSTLMRDLDRLFEHVNTLWMAGARNFAFMNVPPTQKTPFMSTQDTANLVTSINLWNTELPKRLDAFSQLNDLANITLIDMQEPFNDALANPSKYGATDATCQACEGVSPLQTCADPNPKCLWYNSYHPGQPIQKMIADVVAENLSPMWF